MTSTGRRPRWRRDHRALLGLKRWAPAVPGALVAVGVGVAVGARGLLDVALTGNVPSGLPHPAGARPSTDRPIVPRCRGRRADVVRGVVASGAPSRTGGGGADADHELRALGVANLPGDLPALPAGGGLSQTAVNDNAGARTELAGASPALSRCSRSVPDGRVRGPLQATLGALVSSPRSGCSASGR